MFIQDCRNGKERAFNHCTNSSETGGKRKTSDPTKCDDINSGNASLEFSRLWRSGGGERS